MTWPLQPHKGKGPAGVGGESGYSSAEQQQYYYSQGDNNSNNNSNEQELCGNNSYIENDCNGDYSNQTQPKFDFYTAVSSANPHQNNISLTPETAFIHSPSSSSTDMGFPTSYFLNRSNIVASQVREELGGTSARHLSLSSFYTGCYDDELSQQQQQQQQQQTYYNISSRPSSSSSSSLLSTQQYQQQQRQNHHSVTSPMIMPESNTTATAIADNTTDSHHTTDIGLNLTSQRNEPNITQQTQQYPPVDLVVKSHEQLMTIYYHLLQQDHSTLPSQQQPSITYYSDSQHSISLYEQQRQRSLTNLEQQQPNIITESSSNIHNSSHQQQPLLLTQELNQYPAAATTAIMTTEPTEALLSFSLKANSKRTTAEHHQRRQHQCPICKHLFTKHHDLIRHFPTHIPENRRVTYPCPDCDNFFYRKDSITRHRGTSACPKNKENSNNKDKDGDSNNNEKN
ncbi:hypothetical protein INT45_001749 [Circinella minor]|uniref:C2H2-type domain-containing protein n=1 Tax=Circinella minor TaxID=1195481 RepID=A0A8H7S7E9_9FUNG|nr:hypothetical protein INT45_001749 [Circinella minor]